MDRRDFSRGFSNLNLGGDHKSRRPHPHPSREPFWRVSNVHASSSSSSSTHTTCETVYRVYDCFHADADAPRRQRAGGCRACRRSYPTFCHPATIDVRVKGLCAGCERTARQELLPRRRRRRRRRRGSDFRSRSPGPAETDWYAYRQRSPNRRRRRRRRRSSSGGGEVSATGELLKNVRLSCRRWFGKVEFVEETVEER